MVVNRKGSDGIGRVVGKGGLRLEECEEMG